jgi:23S rRNA (uracil1939-C5)-methyltransferase
MEKDITLHITRLGHKGDGVAQHIDQIIHVPLVLPDEELSVTIDQNGYVNINSILTPSPHRVTPPCQFFGQCGGCRMQHMDQVAILQWKIGLAEYYLKREGVDTKIEKHFVTPKHSRRRVTLTAQKNPELILGFHLREDTARLNITQCHIMREELMDLLDPIRTILNSLLKNGKSVDIHATTLGKTIELVFIDLDLTATQKVELSGWAIKHHIARVYLKNDNKAAAEIIIHQEPLIARYGAIAVELPPQAFMQASDEAEAAMLDFIRPYIKSSRQLIDLFCGTGLFSLSFYDKKRKIICVDQDKNAMQSLGTAIKNYPEISIETRNLFRDPLRVMELNKADTIILDPPRSGAAAQIAHLNKLTKKRIIYVSCDAMSFAKDSSMLIKAGYVLKDIKLFDQFLWSAHMELIGVFDKN